jgi:hypothetical protein
LLWELTRFNKKSKMYLMKSNMTAPPLLTIEARASQLHLTLEAMIAHQRQARAGKSLLRCSIRPDLHR